MESSAHLVEAVSQRLGRFLEEQRTTARAQSPLAELLMDAAGHSLGGGKRLRARFCHVGWLAAGGSPGHGIPATAGAAIEAFQAAALVHDDMIDSSDTRRGAPAAHRWLEQRHREAGWAGDAEAFGRNAALLLGDLLVAWSDDLFEEALEGHPSPGLPRAEYAVMRREVTLGQFLDVAQESAWIHRGDEEQAADALAIASLKSARYSVEQPLVIGAALAEGSPELIAALRRFGHPAGLAFQLRDDLLGVFGDSAVTGKPAGDDLREGKRTLLVAYAREGLDDADRHLLDGLLGNPNLSEGHIAGLQKMIRASGADVRIEADIARLRAEAEDALAMTPASATVIAELRALLAAATDRTR